MSAPVQNPEAAKWKRVRVDPALLKMLMQRSDKRAWRDFGTWLALLALFAAATIYLWDSPSSLICLYLYSVLYSTGAQSREHETGHGTAFKTKALNKFFFELTSFMVMKESFLRAKSHDVHHRHTVITAADPEIVTPRPPDILTMALNLFMIERTFAGIKNLVLHAFGLLSKDDRNEGRDTLPDGVRTKAWLWLGVLAFTLIFSLYSQSWLPVLLIGPMPSMFGGTLRHLFALSQHVGLQTDVHDHRLNTRTIYLGPVLGFLYMNMQYHLEHHLYPNVPYYHLPRLHQEIKSQCPPAYLGLWPVFAEMLPVLWRQLKEPTYCITRPLPPAKMA